MDKKKTLIVLSADDVIQQSFAIAESIDWMKNNELIGVKSTLLGAIKKYGQEISRHMNDAEINALSKHNKKRLCKKVIEKSERIVKAAEFIERVDDRLA